MYDVIAFDADDTLWHCESLFHATETAFAAILRDYHSQEWVLQRLLATESKNLARFGYGVKGFILSMIETAIELTESRISGSDIRRILDLGHALLDSPLELIDGVGTTIAQLAATHRLMLITKGDLFDQESKLARSGLGEQFAAVEIVSDKTASTYAAIARRHAVPPSRFLMVGNSLRSDILPVVEIGAMAVYIPYHITWAHERVEQERTQGVNYAQLDSISQLPDWLAARTSLEPHGPPSPA